MNRNSTDRWRLSFWPVLAFICVLPGLLALGAWQVQRGVEKSRAFEEFARASTSAARDVTGLVLDAINGLPAYERVQVHGRYLVNRQFLLDNMPRHGRPGHHVLTPFAPKGADYVIVVDRGWRPGLAANAATAEIELARSATTISGMLAPLPRPALKLGGGNGETGWPRVVQFPDARELATALGTEVAVPRLLLDPAVAQGYERDWSPPGIPPARHYAYAFQWFALAAALAVIFILMARPRRTEEPEQ